MPTTLTLQAEDDLDADGPGAANTGVSAPSASLGANLIWADPGGDATEAFGHLVIIANNGSGCSYDTGTKFQGVGSYKFNSGASNLATFVKNPFELLLAAGTRVSFRFRFDTVPAASTPIFTIVNNYSSSGSIFSVRVVPSGAGVVLRYFDEVSTSTDGTTVLLANTWYRISFGFTLPSANNCNCKIYLDGLQEVSVTGQFTNGRNTSTAYYMGWADVPGANRSCWFDQLVIDDGTDLADIGALLLTAKLPTTANANNFDTTGGTGAVNERALNESNFKQQAGASQVNQNYNLQTAAGGDIDISGKIVVAYMAWLWAKEAAVSGTPKLTLNGTDYAITLTTNPALYVKAITDTSYPSNAAAIGMVSSGTADDTFLYECGVVVVYSP